MRLRQKSVILLTGGTDKGLELTPLKNVLCQKGNKDELNENGVIPVKDLYFLKGTATDKILPELDKEGIKYNGPFESLDKMMECLKENLLKTETPEVVVFSPGATSFGMFNNEFDRGNKYMDAVKTWFNS